MIKASAMFSAHATHVLLRNTLIFLVILFIALFFWLKHGIKIETLFLGKYKIEKLYLKLDKKLTLKANTVTIPKTKSKPSFENIDKTFDNIKYLFTFFDTIDVKNITFLDNHINMLFTDDILYVTSDDYEVAGNIHRIGQRITADISMLYLKQSNITLKGNLSYDFKNNSLSTQGEFDAYNIIGSFVAHKKDDKVTFKLKSREFSDLKTLINSFNLNPSIKSWIVDRVQAKKYILSGLEGEGNITKSGFNMNFDALKGAMLFEGVKIYYQKELDPILAKNFTLIYKNKSLYFDLKNPMYKKRSLENSKIAISGLGTQDTLLELDLHMLTPIDNELQKILKSYHIDIPVKHKGEPVKVDLKMDITLGKDTKKKAKVLVNVGLKKGTVWYKQVKLPLLKGNVTFNNQEKERIKVAVTLNKGIVDIGKTKLSVLGGKGYYVNNIVTLDNVHITENWYEGKVKGKINLQKKNATLDLDVKEIKIGDKKKFIVLKNKKLPFILAYSKNLKIDIPSLGLKIINEKKNMHIEVADIKKIKPYLKNIDIDIDGGSMHILKKSDLYTFKGILKRKTCFFYDKNSVCHTRVPFSGDVNKGILSFYAFGRRLYYNSSKSRIKLKNINIDLKRLLNTRVKTKKGKTKKGKKLVILGNNSQVRYDKYTLLTDSYDIEISPKGNIKASGSLDGNIVQFTKKGKVFSLKALRIKDRMLHPLIGFKGLKNGRYSIKKSGNPNKVMKGQIIVEGGTLSDFKAYNNTLAFINAIPALATLNNPGFSKKWFKITEGVVDYRMMGNRVIFDSIYIKGSSATIVGKGELNIKKKTIDMKLAIQTARELGKIVGNLPLLGYILMGEDKSMTIGLTVKGTLNNPTVKTSAAKDILSLPLNILKRTLESPAYIINK